MQMVGFNISVSDTIKNISTIIVSGITYNILKINNIKEL
uniref:Uncharacterized protein n=1 Tax=uncultured Desulfobacterium sp. TaxID=201089 RepID=E1YGW1_9BACT|nr:unknown protein [uncultured Desulfobacterium sp.]